MNILTAGENGTPLLEFATHYLIQFFFLTSTSEVQCSIKTQCDYGIHEILQSLFFSILFYTCRINHSCADEKVNLINDQDETLSLKSSAKICEKIPL